MSQESPLPKIPNKRKHWGELNGSSEERREIKASEMVSSKTKLEHLLKLQNPKPTKPTTKSMIMTIDNPVVTQTIEVMNQTEVIQSLIDTYTSNNTGNPMVLMPHIDFPPDTTARLLRDDKFLKPLWYLPPIDTDFTRGVPIRRPTISKSVVLEALRKSISGLLRLKGFYEANESALVMLTDGVDEFIKCFMESINDILANEGRDVQKTLDVATVERGYFGLTRRSLTSLHNYYKHDIVQRNQVERVEFQEIFHEYDRLMQQSQNLHKNNIKQEDYMGMLDFTESSAGSSTVIQHTDTGEVVNIMNFLDGAHINSTGFHGTFDPNAPNMFGKTITTFTNDDHNPRRPQS